MMKSEEYIPFREMRGSIVIDPSELRLINKKDRLTSLFKKKIEDEAKDIERMAELLGTI